MGTVSIHSGALTCARSASGAFASEAFFVVKIFWYTGDMKKIKKLVVGNWKMNPKTLAEAKKLAADLKKTLRSVKNTEVAICPPFVYLPILAPLASDKLLLGAQNAFSEPLGAHTGEVSFAQLLQFKVSYVIVGHSERRAMGETDGMVNKKVLAVTSEGMSAVLCVGEKVRDKQGDYFAVVREQIVSALKNISKKSLPHLVIAYEPVWAIGGGGAMATRDIHEMFIFIKKVLHDSYGALSDSVRILYGGSVFPENAGEIIRDGFVQGLLVGRDSLNAKNFSAIIRAVDEIK
jgi:triosephosphate isomerase